jgi:hypothetical protein
MGYVGFAKLSKGSVVQKRGYKPVLECVCVCARACVRAHKHRCMLGTASKLKCKLKVVILSDDTCQVKFGEYENTV